MATPTPTHRISGFSLTHLSGTGCAELRRRAHPPHAWAPRAAIPPAASATFSHRPEHAAPGRYRVSLGPGGHGGADRDHQDRLVPLHVPARTGAANVLFKVADSANGVQARVRPREPDGDRRRPGHERRLLRDRNAVHPVLRRPVRPSLRLRRHRNGRGSARGSDPVRGAGLRRLRDLRPASPNADRPDEGRHLVRERGRCAAENLPTEDPGWSIGPGSSTPPRADGTHCSAGSASGAVTVGRQRTFYTALYHSLLHPNVVSDVNGSYPGTDGQVHAHVRAAHTPTSPSGTSTARRSS